MTAVKPTPEKSSKPEHLQTTELPLFSSEDVDLLGDSSTMVQSIVNEDELRAQRSGAQLIDDATAAPEHMSAELSSQLTQTPPTASTAISVEETRIQPAPVPPKLQEEATFIGERPKLPLQDEPTRVGATPRPIVLPAKNPSGQIPIQDEPTRVGATPRPITIPTDEERSFREEPTRIGTVPQSTSPKISTEFTSEPTAIHVAPEPPSKRRAKKRKGDQFQDEKTNIHRGAVEIELGPGVQLGDYVIESYIGAGGMGEIWKGTDTNTNQKVAIKVLLEELLDNDTLVARFFQEARSVNEIKHPNIIEIFSFSELPDGRPYFVMEFLDGKTLGQYLKDHGPLPFGEISTIFQQICEALCVAHERGIVHRDLKPENIYLLQEDTHHPIVKILDFGVAKLLTPEAKGLTHAGAFIGTPAYVSPEQCSASRELDHRTDIYAVGIILFEMITGRTPFEEPGEASPLVMVKQMSNKAPPPSTMVQDREVPEAVDLFVCSLLEKDPDDRPQRCADLPAMLTKALKEKQDETWEQLGFPVSVYTSGVGEIRKKPNKSLEPIATSAKKGDKVPLDKLLRRFGWPIAALLLLIFGVIIGGYLQTPAAKPPETKPVASNSVPGVGMSNPSPPPNTNPLSDKVIATNDKNPVKEKPPKEDPKVKKEDPKKEDAKKEDPKKDDGKISASAYAGMVDATVQRANFSSCVSIGTGRILTKLTINAKGKATQVITNGSPLGRCVEGVLKKTKFPASGSEQSFTYPVYVK